MIKFYVKHQLLITLIAAIILVIHVGLNILYFDTFSTSQYISLFAAILGIGAYFFVVKTNKTK